MINKTTAPNPRAGSASNSRKNSSPADRLRKAARFVVEALEARQLLSSSTWTNLSSSTPSWDLNSNWSPTTGYPTTGSSATLHVATTVNQTITLGTDISLISPTVGSNSAFTQTIAAGNTLTFDHGTTATALIASGTSPVTLACNIAMASNLTITCDSGETLTITGNIDTEGKTLTINGTGTVRISGSITNSTGSGSLIVESGVAVTLNGSNTYSGGTTVTASNAVLTLANTAGSATGSGAVTVDNGGVLAGCGGALGAVTCNNGAKLSPTPGSTPMTFDSLTLVSASTFLPTLNSDTPDSGYAQVDVSGAVTISGSSVILTLGGTLAAHDQAALNLIDSTSGITTYTNTGLTGNSTYSYEVTAANSAGTSSASASVSQLTIPGVPTSPSATASGTQIALGWTAPTGGASSYNVYRYNGTAYVKINGSAVTSPAYTDTGLTAGNTYSYEITAVNSAGEGTATGSFGATLLPPAPTGVTATLSGSSVIVSWTTANGATSYSIARNDNPTLATGVTSIPYTDSTVVSGGTYAYTVFALNAGGTSGGTTSSSIALAPAAPASLSITAATASSVTLGWSASSGATSYHILEEQDIDGVTSYNVVESTASTSDTVSGLTGDTSYSFEVTAINAAGCSPAVGPQSTGTPPDAPTGLSSIGADSNSISLTWDIVTDAANYTVLRENSGGTSYSAIAADPISGTTVVDSGLTADATYSYEVEVTTSNGTSVGSAPISVTTAPAAPTGLTATAEDTQTLLSWTASTGATSYNIYQYNGSAYVNVTNTAAVTFNGATSAVVTGLTNGTSYSYEVSAVSDAGEGSLSSSASVTPAVSTVEFLTATPASTSEIDLAWNLNTIGAQNIEVDRSPDGSTWTAVTTTLPGTATSYADTGLSENTQYYYQVRAIYPDTTTSAFSVPASASTLPAITGFTATASSASEIDLGWTTNITDATGIEVYRSTDGGDTFSLLASLANTATSYSDTGLTESSAYYYQINAITADGSSEEVASVNAATLAAVDTMTATAASMSEIDLGWNVNVADATALEVDRSADGGTTWTMLTNTLSPSTTTYADTGLADNTDYTYQVRAIRPGGDSAYSAPTDATTVAAIDSLTATAVSTGEIDLGWTLNVTDQTGLSIYRSVDGGDYDFLTDSDVSGTLTSTSTTYADTSVAEGHDYSYEIQATTSSGTTSMSDPADASTAPIQNLDYTPATTSQVITWSNLSTDATSIEIDGSTNGTTYSALVTGLSGSATTYTNTGLTENTEYWYEVKITEPGGATTTDPLGTFTLPAAPTDVTVTSDTPTEVDLSWTNPGSSGTPFFIEQSDDGGTDFAIINETAPGATTYQDTTVTDGTSYVYQVDAVSGDGYNDNPASATVTAYTPLIAPTQLTITPNGPTEMDFSWNNLSQTATGYEIQRKPAGGSWTTIGTVDYADTTEYSDTTPALATQYYYHVLATDGGGNYSTPSNFVTGATGPSIGTLTDTGLATNGATVGGGGVEGSAITLYTPDSYAPDEVDPVTGWNIDWGDGAGPVAETGDPGSFTHTYDAPGDYTITTTSADGSMSGTASTVVTYIGGSVAVTPDSGNVYVLGDSYGVTATFTDPVPGIHVNNWVVDWGDGDVQMIPVSSPSATNDTQHFTHLYANTWAYGYGITIAAETSDGVYRGTTNPFYTGDSPDEGVAQTIGVDVSSDGIWSSFAPPDGYNFAVNFNDGNPANTDTSPDTYAINWGDTSDGSDETTANVIPGETSDDIGHNYGNSGVYVVTVTGTNSEGIESFGLYQVSYLLPTPTVTAVPEQVIGAGTSGTLTLASYSGLASGTDAVAYVDWGDGNAPVDLGAVTPDSSGAGTITATFPTTDGPGVYTPTVTLYQPGLGNETGFFVPPSGDVSATPTLDVWGVKINDGESNDLLIASSDGTQNLQTATLYFPHPAGEALDLTLTSSDNSEDDVWDPSETGPTGDPGALVLGTDSSGDVVSSDSFSVGPSVTSKTVLIGATAGDTTANVFSLSLSGSADTGASTGTFDSEVSSGDLGDTGATGCKGPDDKGSDGALQIWAENDPNGITPNDTDVTNDYRNWIVGQIVNLKEHWTGPQPLPKSYQWTISGNDNYLAAFVVQQSAAGQGSPSNFDNKDFGHAEALSGSGRINYAYADDKQGYGLFQPAVKFFWVATNQSNAPDLVTVTLGADGGLQPGSSVAAESTHFVLYSPTSNVAVIPLGNDPRIGPQTAANAAPISVNGPTTTRPVARPHSPQPAFAVPNSPNPVESIGMLPGSGTGLNHAVSDESTHTSAVLWDTTVDGPTTMAGSQFPAGTIRFAQIVTSP